MKKYIIIALIVIAAISYYSFKWINSFTNTSYKDSAGVVVADTLPLQNRPPATAQSKPKVLVPWRGQIPLDSIVSFSETLIGTPYLYASSNPQLGFDCSGFITYVFNHFGLQVPRSSIEFTNKGVEVSLSQARRGDLILFTGTDSLSAVVGHMGIVTGNTDSLRFIHSSSGKANGVTITSLNNYYLERFVKVINIERGL